jgi:4-hydroxy-tetrahydrodipicolinate reductase
MTRIIINGFKGRMGQALVTCAARNPELKVTGQIDSSGDLSAAIAQAEVVIDFSSHTATAKVAEICAQNKMALVIGTTGHSEAEKAEFLTHKSQIPIVMASNYSTGVNTLFWLTRKAAEILGPGFDLEIIEMHHRLKKDAPSGTADTLAHILATVRKQQVAEVLRHGRKGITGERTSTEIGMHSLRGGDVVGDHTVVFATNGERLELTHKAASRETFANGALRAAQWIVQQKPGLYNMQDVLGLT